MTKSRRVETRKRALWTKVRLTDASLGERHLPAPRGPKDQKQIAVIVKTEKVSDILKRTFLSSNETFYKFDCL